MSADYRVFGLVVRANRPLPHLLGVPGPRSRNGIDLRFELSGRSGIDADGSIDLTFRSGHRAMRFVVDRAGNRIWGDWADGAARSAGDVAGILAGPVIGGLLRLRGALSLHASVVEVGSSAVVFLGERGAGKSTLAAAGMQRGRAVISDDIAAITEQPDGGWLAHPGYPRLRLHPATTRAMGIRAPEAGPVWVGQAKRYVALSAGEDGAGRRFRAGPLPVGAVYELRRDPAATSPSVVPLEGGDRVGALLRHSRAPLAPLDAGERERELLRLGRLAAAVPIERLVIPEDLEALPGAWETIAGRAVA